MKKRIVILIIMIIFLTSGCKVNYDLVIDDNNNLEETTTITSEGNENVEKEYLYAMYLEEYPIFYSEEFLYYNPNEKKSGNTYYNKTIKELDNGYSATYKANYTFENYNDSRMLKESFLNVDIGYKNYSKYYYIKLSELKLFNLDNYITNISINIKVSDKYVVTNNNADKITGNTYTWVFKNKNANLILEYKDKNTVDDNKIIDNLKKEDTSIYILLMCIGGFVIIMLVILKIKNKYSK